jgi:methylglutaconyl-CoA hydratase
MTEILYVNTQIHQQVATITFFHPQSNAMPAILLKSLTEAITQAGENDNIRVIVLKSGGERTFCSGASFDELAAIADLEAGKAFFLGFANVINACRKAPKFIIGRVQGKAVGGGVGIAAVTDICLASQYAAIKLSELVVGIAPLVVGPAIERKIGKAAFAQLAINATEFYPASWAKEKGLFAAVFEEISELDHAVQTLASTLVNYSPEAMKTLKQVLWEGTEHWDELLRQRAEMSGKLILSDFSKKFLEDFQKKNT